MVTKRLAPWILVVGLLVVLSLVAACSGGGTATTTTKTTAPTTTKTTAPTTTAKTTTPAATTTPSGPPAAKLSVHQAVWNNTPPICLGCHVVGATPLPPGLPQDHAGRTVDTCKTCHQLGS